MIGAFVGLAGGVVLVAAMALHIPALVSAGLAIATTVLATGGLHEDGSPTLPTASARPRPRRSSPSWTIAAWAPTARWRWYSRCCCGSRRWRPSRQTGSFRAAFVLIAAESVSRAALVRLWHDLPAARSGGLSNDAGVPDQNAMLVALAVAAVVAVVAGVPSIGLWPTLLAGALAALGTYGMIRLMARTLGGRTGDSLGACQQVAVAAFLIGASIA